MINGFDVEGRRFVGSSLDWFTPFNLFCGLGLIVAYTLLATTWLIMKSEGALQNRMRELTRHVLLALIAVIAVVSIWTRSAGSLSPSAGLLCLTSSGSCQFRFWWRYSACGSGG